MRCRGSPGYPWPPDVHHGPSLGVDKEFNFDRRHRRLTPEMELWTEAICLALRDAAARSDTTRRAEARSFLVGRSVDNVLHGLGSDPAWWRSRVVPHLLRTWSTIDDAGPTERAPELVERYRRAAITGIATRAAKAARSTRKRLAARSA